jgi:hypothetical protein
LNTKCVFCFSVQLLSETFLILRRTERDMIKNVHWSSCKVPLFLSNFNETGIFSTVFLKNALSSYKKIRPSGGQVVPRGQTDRYDEANKFPFATERTLLKSAPFAIFVKMGAR